MKPELMDARMRAMECFHTLKVVDGAFPIVRVDGRSFSRLTENDFEKPFDGKFHAAMARTAVALLEELHGAYAFTESDEISVVCPPDWDFFDREVEKIVSVSAAIAASTFSIAIGRAVAFDSRLVVAVDAGRVVEYFRWRQADAGRCALNGWSYWTLRKEGRSVAEATKELEGRDIAFKNELLFARGVNFASLPAWQRRGTGVYWEQVDKTGFNPKTQEQVVVQRTRSRVDEELPEGEAYGRFVEARLKDARSAR